jgi:LAO/AO transport system kinase
MNTLSTDQDVFIRSMATRGSMGGLAISSQEVADLLDAFGFDFVLVETVGVGQSELDIATVADTTVVALVPESGDSIQAMKAGLMEIADLFVVNKADRAGADRLVTDIEITLHLRTGEGQSAFSGRPGLRPGRVGEPPEHVSSNPKGTQSWTIPVLKTESLTGAGIAALLAHLDNHAEFLDRTGELKTRRRQRYESRTRSVVERDLRVRAWTSGSGQQILAENLDSLEAGTESPYSLAARIVRNLGLQM